MASVEEFPVAGNAGNYGGVRFNALKHGILSQLTVLPHESAEEFSELLDGLIAEHRPAGMTEQHLVEELAAIIWRKRRVLQAEGATINRGLRRVAQSSFDSPVPAAAPFERGLREESIDLPDLMTTAPDEIADRRNAAQEDLAATRHAAAILSKRGGEGVGEGPARADG